MLRHARSPRQSASIFNSSDVFGAGHRDGLRSGRGGGPVGPRGGEGSEVGSGIAEAGELRRPWVLRQTPKVLERLM